MELKYATSLLPANQEPGLIVCSFLQFPSRNISSGHAVKTQYLVFFNLSLQFRIRFQKYILSKLFGTEKTFVLPMKIKKKQKPKPCILWNFPFFCLFSCFPTCLNKFEFSSLIKAQNRESSGSRDQVILVSENCSVPRLSSPLDHPAL